MTILPPPRVLLPAAGLLGGGLLAVTLAVMLPQFGTKGIAALGGLGVIGAVILLTGRPKEVFLTFFVFALTYNRQYYGGFSSLLGPGFYWVPADLMLLCLFATNVVEGCLGRARMPPPVAEVASAPVLPFLFAALLSTLAAERIDLAAGDTFRIVKFALLLAWLHRNMDRSLWLTLVGALAASVTLQATFGTLQVVFKAGQSLLSIIGAGSADALPEEIDNRARGTLGHPNMIAPYLLMLAPGAFGVAIFSRSAPLKLVALAITAIAIAGMVATKSRAPGVLLLGALVGTAMAGAWLRALTPKALLGAGIWALLIIALALLPFLNDIIERFRGDFGVSITFRADYNRVGMLVFSENPLLGIGFGSSAERMAQLWWVIADELIQVARFAHLADVRAGAPIHNVYVVMLAEAGTLGFLGFCILLVTVVLRGIRGVWLTTAGSRGVCVGLTAGMLVQIVQQTLDFSLWWDPSWYTLALIAAVLGTAPRIRPGLP
ncbi:O-antigen ligase family protein [Roseomonas sp. CAU 1739]|uniref:O-antigen ligase family protein n=1 Tax=Roseomonas sp. CAU 1739 TaxID=3140364 RepID=UPI00325C1E9B